MKKIECVIMDWAGTAVDYGCFAPVAAFLKAFAEKGLTVTMEEARGPMGMTKIDHIRELFKLPSVTEQFKQNYNRNWTEEDVVSIYKEFEKHLFTSLEEYTTPIPGVIEVIEKLKRDGIKIGSTTGYTTAMMDIRHEVCFFRLKLLRRDTTYAVMFRAVGRAFQPAKDLPC